MTYKQLISHFGSAQEVAKAISVSHQAVYKWKAKGYVPIRAQRHIAAITGGKLRATKRIGANG